MPQPYSTDLRERVLVAYEQGEGSQVAIARRFRVCPATVCNWIRQARQEGRRSPKPHRGGLPVGWDPTSWRCCRGSWLNLRMTSGSWRVDETYIRVKGKWVYLYRAVDASGRTIDFLLSPKRNAAAARRFFRKALKQAHTVNPRTITVDKNAAYPIATKTMKWGGELWRFAKLREVK